MASSHLECILAADSEFYMRHRRLQKKRTSAVLDGIQLIHTLTPSSTSVYSQCMNKCKQKICGAPAYAILAGRYSEFDEQKKNNGNNKENGHTAAAKIITKYLLSKLGTICL